MKNKNPLMLFAMLSAITMKSNGMHKAYTVKPFPEKTANTETKSIEMQETQKANNAQQSSNEPFENAAANANENEESCFSKFLNIMNNEHVKAITAPIVLGLGAAALIITVTKYHDMNDDLEAQEKNLDNLTAVLQNITGTNISFN